MTHWQRPVHRCRAVDQAGWPGRPGPAARPWDTLAGQYRAPDEKTIRVVLDRLAQRALARALLGPRRHRRVLTDNTLTADATEGIAVSGMLDATVTGNTLKVTLGQYSNCPEAQIAVDPQYGSGTIQFLITSTDVRNCIS